MLLGERLGRRHQRRLVAGLERAQHRVQGDRRSCPSRPRPSAAAASARPESRSASISPNAARWSPVSSNGSEASQRATSSAGRPRAIAIPGRSSRRARRRAASATWCRKQLLEREPLAGERDVLGVARESGPRAGRRPRAASRRRRAAPPAAARSRASAASRRLPGPLADPLRAQALARRGGPGRSRSCGCRSRRSRRAGVEDLVRGDLEPLALELAVEQHPRPGRQPLGEPGLVEPDRLHRAARVGDGRPRRSAGCGAGSAAPGPSGPRPRPSPPRRSAGRRSRGSSARSR